MNRSRSLTLSFIFVLSVVSGPALEAQIDSIASFSTAAPSPCYDGAPVVASQSGGSFLLLWTRVGCSPGILSLHRALRFDAAGRRLGEEVELWYGQDTVLAPLPDGGFVAASARESLSGPVPQGAIRLHRLDPLGRPVGQPILVILDHDEFVTSTEPRLAVAPNGSVAVVWTTFNWNSPGSVLAMGRFFNASLAPLTEAFPLSFIATGAQGTPDVAFADDSTALAIWAQSSDYLIYDGIYGRRFDASGHPISEAFPIQEDAGQPMYDARLVAGASGGWWAAWSRFGRGQSREARLLRLGPGGGPILAEQALGLPQAELSRPALGTNRAGQAFLLGLSVDGKIVGRLFDDTDLSESSPFVLSEGSDGALGSPALSSRSSGGLVAAWPGSLPSDATRSGLFGAILAPPCLEGKSAACLGPEARYGVEVAWQLGAQSGTAKPLPLAGNVATFGLRNAADHDVTVLLSGPGSRDLTFAATTGAALEIRVTDKTTGAVRTFSKPAGRFVSRRIPGALPNVSGAAEIEAPPSARDLFEPAAQPAVGETCTATARALCLLGGRFRAELLAGPNPRPALALLRTDRSGAFAFPSAPETPVTLLTMIDGRPTNGKFWVYLGGLSRAGYTVKITDLSTGIAKTYSNPAGKLESRADRAAF